jgi:hypothetical protein
MSLGNCEYCDKPLRRCKRIDVEGRTMHFSCIEKLKKERYQQKLQELIDYLKSKNIELIS